jgi:phospholipid/cholesterol/gamma-HCH transport system substrate-binding protein
MSRRRLPRPPRLPRGRGLLLAGAGVLVLALVVAGVLVWRTSGPDDYRVTATFTEAPGVYEGNAVKILGVPVGRVTRVEPGPKGVEVELKVSGEHRLPADVSAFLMAPNAVNDRFIELAPAYSGSGPHLDDGDRLGVDRTVVPQSVDQIIDNLDEFARTLGPEGANADGSLSRVLAALADSMGGQGSTIHELVDNLGTTLDATAADSDALTSGLTDLGELSTAAAGVSTTYRNLAENLASVSGTLAGDAPQVTAVLTNLQDLLAELNTFVKENKDQIAGTITSLSGVAGEVGKQQKSLTRLMRNLPLAVSNAGNTVVDTPGGKAVRARLDPVANSPVRAQICGDGLLRLMAASLAAPAERTVLDVACGADRWLDELAKPKGAPDGAAWTRQALERLGS